MKNPTKLAGYNLWLATQFRQKSLNRVLKPHDITHAQYMLMEYLHWADKKNKLSTLSQNKIAQELNLDAMMISNILKLVEKKGWVIRQKAEGSTTANMLAISPEGKTLIKQVSPLVEKFEKHLFDDSMTKKLKKMSKKMIESVK